jgi:hypothetical protein
MHAKAAFIDNSTGSSIMIMITITIGFRSDASDHAASTLFIDPPPSVLRMPLQSAH